MEIGFFPIPEKLRRDYSRNYNEVMKSILDKSSWKPFHHVNPIFKGGLETFYPSLQANYNQRNLDSKQLPSWSIPMLNESYQTPIEEFHSKEKEDIAKPQDPLWEFQMDNVIHQIEKEVPEKIKFKDTFSNDVLSELTSSIPLYQKGENYYGYDRPLRDASKQIIDEAKVFENFEQSLAKIVSGDVPKLNHIQQPTSTFDQQHPTSTFNQLQPQQKLSDQEIHDIRNSIHQLAWDLEWRIAFANVMHQLISHIPKFGILDVSQMPTDPVQAKSWMDQQNNYKQNYDNAMKLIKNKSLNTPSAAPFMMMDRSKYFYGGQQYLNQQPILQKSTIPSIQSQPQPQVVTEFVEIKTDAGSQFMSLSSAKTVPITYKTVNVHDYGSFQQNQQQQQPTLQQPHYEQKLPYSQQQPLHPQMENVATETTKTPFGQKVKDAFKRIVKPSSDKAV